jgi:hypothetical protein
MENNDKAPPILPGTVDASNKFEDLSGIDITVHANPYDALIQACNDDPVSHASPLPVLKSIILPNLLGLRHRVFYQKHC